MFGWNPSRRMHYLTLAAAIWYYGTNEGEIVLEELHKQIMEASWKVFKRNVSKEMGTGNNKLLRKPQDLKLACWFMVKNYACHTFEPKHLLDNGVLKILNDSTLLLVMPNRKEGKTNINDFKPFSTTDLVENAWDSFLGSIKTKHHNSNYNLRPKP